MSDEPFLSRWSRLKRRHGGAAPVPAETMEPAAPQAEPPTADAVPAVAEPPAVPADEDPAPEPELELPPIESLTAESDYTPFLRAGVPEEAHRAALRKLWTSDPVYANLDGLKDYDDDYGALFDGSVSVKTLYRVGQGFLDAIGDEAPAPVAEGGAEAVPGERADNGGGDGEPPQDPDTVMRTDA